MNGIEKLIQLFQRDYYGDLILGVAELMAIIIGILYVGKDKTGVFFILYLLIDLLILLIGWWLYGFGGLTKSQINHFIHITNPITSMTELVVYYFFFSKVFQTPKADFFFKLMGGIFLILFLLLITTEFKFFTNRLSYVSKLLSVISFVLLLPPCGFYYLKLLKDASSTDLLRRPSFWIVTGIFFFSLFSIPFYLLDGYLSSNKYKFIKIMFLAFFYFPFITNIAFLIRAFLCKKTLTT